MNINRHRCLLFVTVAAIAGCLGGLWLGAQLFTLQVRVDYQSGAVSRQMSVGPFLVRTELESLRFFERVKVVPKSPCKPAEWHTALFFRGPLVYYSPNIQPSGEVYRSLRRLDDMFYNVETSNAVPIKRAFLSLLSSNAMDAIKYAEIITVNDH